MFEVGKIWRTWILNGLQVIAYRADLSGEFIVISLQAYLGERYFIAVPTCPQSILGERRSPNKADKPAR